MVLPWCPSGSWWYVLRRSLVAWVAVTTRALRWKWRFFSFQLYLLDSGASRQSHSSMKHGLGHPLVGRTSVKTSQTNPNTKWAQKKKARAPIKIHLPLDASKASRMRQSVCSDHRQHVSCVRAQCLSFVPKIIGLNPRCGSRVKPLPKYQTH